MAWRVGEPQGSTAIPTGAQYIRENNAAIEVCVGSARLAAGTYIVGGADAIPAGTKMWFYQNTAPAGWVIVSVSDRLLAVKGGSTYTTGGASAGTWQQTDVSLTMAQTPAHTHQANASVQAASGGGPIIWVYFTQNSLTGPKQGTATGSPHNHGNTFRPAASVGIICEKSAY